MYEAIRRIVLPLLRLDAVQPHPPAGHQAHDHVEILRAAPVWLHYRLLLWGLYALAWSAGITAASTAILLTTPLGIVLVIPLIAFAAAKAVVLYVVTRLDYENRWYVITDRSLLIRQGVWMTREITLTFANAQNVRITQGPLQRIFGISNVEVDTAGGGAKRKEEKQGLAFDPHRAVLRGLDRPGDVRRRIVELVRRSRSAGLGDPDEPDAACGDLSLPVLEDILSETRRLSAIVVRGA